MKNKTLRGRFDNQVAGIPEVETLKDTFRITVKVEDWEKGDDVPEGATINKDGIAVWYENDKEPYEYRKVPSLTTALELYGAQLSDDQKQFLDEALKGSEETGKAVKKVVDTLNDDLKTKAKNNAYQSLFNEKLPLTEENVKNAHASIIRNFMKTSNVSDEVAVNTLKTVKVIPEDYTVEMFRANKGKR